jgi:hypothetical protein
MIDMYQDELSKEDVETLRQALSILDYKCPRTFKQWCNYDCQGVSCNDLSCWYVVLGIRECNHNI